MESELAQQILKLKDSEHLCLFYDKDAGACSIHP